MSTVPVDKDRASLLKPNLWYLHGTSYDFSKFVAKHPGGEQAINLGKGRDCTALFESYHTRLPSIDILKKYEVDSEIGEQLPDTFSYEDDDFYRIVKKRALQYFEENGYSNYTKGGFYEILGWTINLFVFCFSLYASCYLNWFASVWAIVFGVSKSLMVIRSTHSASHYAFSQSPVLNRIVYWTNMAVLGDTPAQWTAKHVIAHHIDTNITPIDDDTMYPIKRVLPSHKHEWYHQYQHLYIWFLYAFVFVPWSVSHNIKFLIGVLFNDGTVYEGCVNVQITKMIDWIECVSCILVHYFVRLLPFIYLPTWTQSIIIALIMELSSSAWFSLQFAVNHETMESVSKSGGNEEIFKQVRDFGSHQLLTSHNYSIGFLPALHMSGGLNYQIEHHLFPSVHFKYYPDLSQIVQKTAKEFSLPYNSSQSFWVGVKKHYRLLKFMGSNKDKDA